MRDLLCTLERYMQPECLKNFVFHVRRGFERRLSLLRNDGPDLAQPATYAVSNFESVASFAGNSARARVTGRSGKGGRRSRPRVIVRHGATIIKGKCRDRNSLVTSRGGRDFSSLGTYDSPMCRMPCHHVLRICPAFIMLAARDRCALMPSETNAPARPQSLTRTRAALLHPQLVHHAYRCIALKAKFTLLNCATASVKRRRATRHLYLYTY